MVVAADLSLQFFLCILRRELAFHCGQALLCRQHVLLCQLHVLKGLLALARLRVMKCSAERAQGALQKQRRSHERHQAELDGVEIC